MDYYYLLLMQERQKNALREREQRRLAAEARLAQPAPRRFLPMLRFHIALPRRRPQPQPCPGCPEYA